MRLLHEALIRAGHDARLHGDGILVLRDKGRRTVITLTHTTPPSAISADRILSLVAEECGTSVHKLLAPDRSRLPARRRGVAIYMLKKYTRLSWPKIGAVVRRDHSTAMTAQRRVERDLLLAPNDTSRLVAAVEARIAQVKAMTAALRAATEAPPV